MSGGNDLCSVCGLCCSGWMFSTATLAEDERDRFRAMVPPGGSGLPQPCVFHDGHGCGVYDQRPTGCRNFSCATRDAWLDGRLTLESAAERVGEVRTMLAELVTLMRDAGWTRAGEPPAVAWMRLVHALPSMTSPDDRRRHARLLVEAVVVVKALKSLDSAIDIG